jgi:cysteine desulfurase
MVVYADNSATTKVRPEVIEAMLPYLSESWGNASSIHSIGRKSKEAIDQAREEVARLLNCDPEEVLFSGCGTVSNNLAILGRARFVEANQGGRHLITTQIEHPSAFGPAQYLEGQGWKVTYLPVDRDGIVDVAAFENALGDDTSIVSITWANNEIGSVQPIAEMAKIAQERKIFFHSDAVQAPGKLKLDMKEAPLSSLSLSGHKFYAPKGIGVFFLRQGENVMPVEFGGGQERGLLPGTESVANIVAIGKAADLAYKELEANQKFLIALQERFMLKLLEFGNLKITGPADISKRIPGHVSFVVPGAEGEALVMRCDLKGVCVSSGSACHKGVIEPSHVLKALRLSDHEAMGSLRVSFGKYNSIEDCDAILNTLAKVVFDPVVAS